MAEIVISALGILEITKLPNIVGIDSFKGDIFHSGEWNHNVKLNGRRVAVIGNGASACVHWQLLFSQRSQLFPTLTELNSFPSYLKIRRLRW
jgi:lysine/ornithine N-monooxygenase